MYTPHPRLYLDNIYKFLVMQNESSKCLMEYHMIGPSNKYFKE